MKLKLKRGLVYNGEMYKSGESIEVDNYAFPWLRDGGWLEQSAPAATPEIDDGLVVTEELPPLYDEPKKSKGKRDV